MFYKLRTKLNEVVLKLLYFAFVYPQLLYGVEIYGNTYPSHLNKLEKLNNKILRILQNKSLRSHTIELYKQYNTLPVSLLHSYQIILFVHKCIYHPLILPDIYKSYFTPNSLIHRHDTRDRSGLHLAAIHTIYGRRAITHKGSMLWNNLPGPIKLIQSICEFKARLKQFTITQYECNKL